MFAVMDTGQVVVYIWGGLVTILVPLIGVLSMWIKLSHDSRLNRLEIDHAECLKERQESFDLLNTSLPSDIQALNLLMMKMKDACDDAQIPVTMKQVSLMARAITELKEKREKKQKGSES